MALNRDRLILELYSLFAEEAELGECLGRLAPALNSHITTLRTEDISVDRANYLAVGSLGPDDLLALVQSYSTRWSDQNVWMQRSVTGLLTQGYQVGEAVISDSELVASTYYRQCLRPLGIRHGGAICLWTDRRNDFVVLGINRRPSAGPLTLQDVSLMRMIRPHLVNLYGIYRRIARLEASRRSLRSSLDRLPIGVLVLDNQGQIVQANLAAERRLQPLDAIRLVRGVLQLRDARANLQLRNATAALTTPGYIGYPQTILVRTPNSDSTPSFVLQMCPMPPDGSATVSAGRVLVFILDLNQAQDLEVGRLILQRTFGLTPMESRVVMSLRSQPDLESIARELGVAISTIRTHLKHAFLKTGTCKQSELALLADRLVWSAPEPSVALNP